MSWEPERSGRWRPRHEASTGSGAQGPGDPKAPSWEPERSGRWRARHEASAESGAQGPGDPKAPSWEPERSGRWRPRHEASAGEGAAPPLAGRTVLVARPDVRGSALAAELVRLGARVFVAPVTASAPPDDPADLDRAVAALGGCAWVAVTSVNGVDSIAEAARRTGVDLSAVQARWAAVGPATATALRGLGIEPDLVARGTGAALVEAFGPAPVSRPRVLLPLGDLASGTLERGLLANGWSVERVVAYRTVPAALPDDVVSAARERRLDLAVVAAGSAAREVARQLGPDAPAVVTIGEPSAIAAREAGLVVVGVAAAPTDEALAACVTAALAGEGAGQWNAGGLASDGAPAGAGG